MYFDVQNSNPMSIFVCRDLKNRFFQIVEKKRYCGKVFLRQAAMGRSEAPKALRFVPRCLQSALPRRPKLRFGPEKLIDSTLFAAGCNDTLEFISNLTEQLYF